MKTINTKLLKTFFVYDPPTVSPRGTAAAILCRTNEEEPWEMYVGVALCSPDDRFVRVTGRNKALGRATQKRGLTPEQRQEPTYYIADNEYLAKTVIALMKNYILNASGSYRIRKPMV